MKSVFDSVIPLFSCKDIFKTQNFTITHAVPMHWPFLVSTRLLVLTIQLTKYIPYRQVMYTPYRLTMAVVKECIQMHSFYTMSCTTSTCQCIACKSYAVNSLNCGHFGTQASVLYSESILYSSIMVISSSIRVVITIALFDIEASKDII